MIKKLSLVLAAASLFAGCSIATDVQKGEVKNTVSAEIAGPEFTSLIIKMENAASSTRAAGSADMTRFGSVVTRGDEFVEVQLNQIATRAVQNGDIKSVLDYYNSQPGVVYAEPNYIMKAFAAPNDPYYQYQWHMKQLEMDKVWDKSTGEGVIVAVIDTGVAYREGSASGKAPDLQQTAFAEGYDFVNRDAYADDDNSHGTHVAGTIAQSTNNSAGVAGMAYNATIMPIKVLNAEGTGSSLNIADSVKWAADNGAKVINMSLGGGGFSQTMNDACKYAYDKGVAIFAATGNDGTGSVSYPAAYDKYVIAVGATRFDKAKSYYSQYGTSLDIVAPGGDVNVDQDSDGYTDGVLQQTIKGYDKTTKTTDYTFGYYFYQGTSMATPHAAGLAALLFAVKPDATPDQIRAAMESSAEDLGAAGWDQSFGHGLINPMRAIAAISGTTPTDTTAPTVPLSLSATPEANSVSLTWNASSDTGSGVSGYNVYMEGVQVTTVTTASAVVTGLTANTTYSFSVSAVDNAGNESAQSAAVSVTTKEESTPVTEEWTTGVYYNVGDTVTYRNKTYRCRQAHYSIFGWTPKVVASLWERI